MTCRLAYRDFFLVSHAFGPHSQRGSLGNSGRSTTMITREAFGPHSTRGGLGSNFSRSIKMITRKVLELDIRALFTASSLYYRELPLFQCCSERPAYLESRQRSAVVYSSISRFCFVVFDNAIKGPVRVDGWLIWYNR